ncbi:unnamed protein product [Closterium sp. Naga37s-1]|nr:unnamed protein product [Closterium sp. Naga37s-1]
MEYAGVGVGGMEEGMVQLQQRLRSAEAKAEEVLLVKQEVSEGDSLLLGGTFTSPGVAHQRCCASAVVPLAVLSHVQPLPFTSHIHRAAPLSPLAAHPFTIHTRPSHPRLVDTHRQGMQKGTHYITPPTYSSPSTPLPLSFSAAPHPSPHARSASGSPLVDLDRQRNAGREAITALKKHARGAAARRAGARREGGSGGGAAGEGVSAESHRPLVIPLPAVPCGMSDSVGGSECAVCGAVGQKERVWVAMGRGEVFVRMPLHHAHVHVKRAFVRSSLFARLYSSALTIQLFTALTPSALFMSPTAPSFQPLTAWTLIALYPPAGIQRMDEQMEEGREKQKAAVRQLTEEGGLAGRVGEGIVHALTTLKDASK